VPQDVHKLVADFSGMQPSGSLDVQAFIHDKTAHSWTLKPLKTGQDSWCLPSDGDIDQIVFVLDDHGYAANGDVAGQWTLQAVSDPCTPTAWKVDVENKPGIPVPRPAAGAYSGPGDIECDEFSSPTANKWHAYFGTGSQAVNGVNSIDITTGPPAIVSAIISGDTTNLGDWQVSAIEGSVQVNIQDHGGQDVTISAHGDSFDETIDASLVCSVVQRFQN